jgi:hypothetical protein
MEEEEQRHGAGFPLLSDEEEKRVEEVHQM